ncbi:hypothetical protein ABZS94_26055 [Streptomyces sp. NPDC005500]|uniref:hypothetical protein n=1 Tax=Streptomyces sp. NPDC005500 TaxID=3155007 RepID=UPI0033A924A3
MDSFEPVTDDYPDDRRLPLLTAAEARDAVSFMQKLEALELTPHGRAAGALAHDLARHHRHPAVPPPVDRRLLTRARKCTGARRRGLGQVEL